MTLPRQTLLLAIALAALPVQLTAQAGQPRDAARTAYTQAQQAYEAERYEEVHDLLRRALDLLGSSNPRIEALRAQAYFGAEDYDRAEEAVERFFALEPRGLVEEMTRLRSDIQLKRTEATIPSESATMTARPQLQNPREVSAALATHYPPVLRDAGIGGTVVLWLYIGEDGVVQSARVNESAGYDDFDAAALRVARVMRFSPARDGGEPVAAWVSLNVGFGVN